MIKKLNLFSFCTTILLLVTSTAGAQYYTGIGLHIGRFATGVSVKYFFDANNANGIEVIAAKTRAANGGYQVTALYEMQLPINNSLLRIPLDFVFGGGVHAGYYPEGHYTIRDGLIYKYDDKVFSVGLDAVLGLEYKIPVAPLTIGVACIPFFEVVNPGPEFIDFSVAIRYVFQ
jgi:hypothetical protein